MRRTCEADSPEARIAIVARELVVRMIKPYPNTPDYADFRDALRPFIRLEILRARLETMKQFGTYPEALKVQEEIDLVQREILKWEETQ